MVQTKEERKARRAETTRIWRENNKEYLAEYNKQWREKNKESWAEYNKQWRGERAEHCKEYSKLYHQTPEGRKTHMLTLWRRRGVINITEEMYNHYIATTHCECCSKEFSSSFDKCLDHDHKTGEFRWVICRACNTQDNWKKKFNIHLVQKTAGS